MIIMPLCQYTISQMLTDKETNRQHSASAALLWDESHLWGLMAIHSLSAAELPFDIITADDVKNGCLKQYNLLFVPGGWASNKTVRLGKDGAEEIKKFVCKGGIYFGVCGGAGLALEVKGGLGLLPVTRIPTSSRVPSFAGSIGVNLNSNNHDLWRGFSAAQSPTVFHAWWPSQFSVPSDSGDIKILASYGNPGPDAYSSDIPVSDINGKGEVRWKELEEAYGILLDPKRLKGEPAVICGSVGKGQVILSLLHFDTHSDNNGSIVLKNLWALAGVTKSVKSRLRLYVSDSASADLPIYRYASHLIEVGIRNFLWRWRNPYLIQWRRGVRGLEFCNLYVLTREVARLLHHQSKLAQDVSTEIKEATAMMKSFAVDAADLLIMERIELQTGRITFKDCSNSGVAALREDLFSKSKSHGGRFKELLDTLENIILIMYKNL